MIFKIKNKTGFQGKCMSFKDSCIVYSAKKDVAYKLREKSKDFGLFPESISDLNEFFKMLIRDKFELIIADSSLYFRYNDIMKSYLNNIVNGYIIYVGDNYEDIISDNHNIFSCKYEDLGGLIITLNDLKVANAGFSNKIPDELVYKYATENLLEFKFSPSMQGYSYIKQCIISGMRFETYHINLTKDIYREVALINDTTIANVETDY